MTGTHSPARKIAALATLCLALAASGCSGKRAWRSTQLFFFDTVCEVNLFCTAAEFESAVKSLSGIFREVEDSFAPGSDDLSSPRVLRLFLRARRFHVDSGGVFDITLESLARLWGFRDGRHRVPSAEEVGRALTTTGMGKVVVENGRLKLPPGLELDWGGIAKGLAVDLAYESLRTGAVERGFINAGGDLYCWGSNPEGEGWKIGIKDPRREGFIGVLDITNLGAATSGDYQRFFESSGVRYHHIFDPRTGFPARGKMSVTIVGPETTVCDALSTAVFVSPEPESLMRKFSEYGAIIVDQEGRVCFLGKKFRFQATPPGS